MTDFARIYSWNPFRSNAMCYSPEGEGGGAPASGSSGGSSAPGAAAGEASGGSPAPTPDGGGGGSGSSATSGAGDVSPSPDGGDSFSGLDEDFDAIDLGLDGAPQGDGLGGSPPEGTQPQATPAATPPQGGTTPPAAVPQPSPAPASPSPSSAPRSAREELDDAISGFKNNFTELSDWATGELFALSEEDRNALDTDAVTMIPKLMARTYTKGLAAAANLIRQFVPQMVAQGFTQSQQAAQRAASAKQDFYKAWPDLNPEQHDAAMNKWAKVFRQANPQASRADAIQFVGRAVMSEFNVSPGAPRASNGRPSASFQPARPGGRAPTPPPVHDPYAGMDQDFLDSE